MSSSRILKSIVPPLLWNIGSRFKRRVVRSTTLLEYAPRGWDTPLPGHAGSDNFWGAFIAQEQAFCRALIARIEAGEPMLYQDDDENSKYAVFGYVLRARNATPTRVCLCSITAGVLATTIGSPSALVPGVQLDYHCKELPPVAEAGRLISPWRDLAHRRHLSRRCA